MATPSINKSRPQVGASESTPTLQTRHETIYRRHCLTLTPRAAATLPHIPCRTEPHIHTRSVLALQELTECLFRALSGPVSGHAASRAKPIGTVAPVLDHKRSAHCPVSQSEWATAAGHALWPLVDHSSRRASHFREARRSRACKQCSSDSQSCRLFLWAPADSTRAALLFGLAPERCAASRPLPRWPPTRATLNQKRRAGAHTAGAGGGGRYNKPDRWAAAHPAWPATDKPPPPTRVWVRGGHASRARR